MIALLEPLPGGEWDTCALDVDVTAPHEMLDQCAGCGNSKWACETDVMACPGCDCQTLNPLWGPIEHFERMGVLELLVRGLRRMPLPWLVHKAQMRFEDLPFEPAHPYPMEAL